MNTKIKKIKCVVACFDSQGKPTFFPCIIECTEQEYEIGEHYCMAREKAREAGYENSMVVFDQHDGPKWLFERFWHSKRKIQK